MGEFDIDPEYWKSQGWEQLDFDELPQEQHRKFGPKVEGHPSIGEPCPACRIPFQAGDYTTLVAIGPGSDPEAQRKAILGEVYNAVAIEAHWSCVTGRPA